MNQPSLTETSHDPVHHPPIPRVRPGAASLLATLALLSAAPPSRAELQVYFSRQALAEAVAQPLFTEDFESFRSDRLLDLTPLVVLGGSLQLSSQSSHNVAIRLDTPPNAYGEGGIDDPDFGQGFVYSEINNTGQGLLRIDLPAVPGRQACLGFDYSGAGGPSPNGLPFFLSYRVTTADGTSVAAPLPDHDGDTWPDDDGFIGFYDPDSPIQSVELLTFSDPIVPPGHPNYNDGNLYAIDNVVTALPDQDHDGMPDFYEDAHGFDQSSPDPDTDPDADGVPSLEEFRIHTNPLAADTDADGLEDGAELSTGSDPTDRDDPHPSNLWIDFGEIEAGEPYHNDPGTDLGAGGFPSRAYAAFAANITLTLESPDTGAPGALHMVTQSNSDGSWSTSVGDLAVARDFLAVDTRISGGGNGDYDGENGHPTRLALRLGGLPGGTYRWSSFHHDLDTLHTEFITEISTDSGNSFHEIGRRRMTHGRTAHSPFSDDTRYGPALELLPSTVHTVFRADGSHEVIIRFTPLAMEGPDTRGFGINGFQLTQTEAALPLQSITAITVDPARAAVSLTWASEMGSFYTIYSSETLRQQDWQSRTTVPGQASQTTFELRQPEGPLPPRQFFHVYEWKLPPCEGKDCW